MVKTPAFIICIASVGVIISIIRGASAADQGNSYLVADVQEKAIDVISGLSDQIKTVLTNTSSNPSSYYSPVNDSTFSSVDNIIEKFQDGYNTYVNDYQTYVTNAIRIGMNCLGAVPFVFFILLPIYASKDDCRRIWPWCTTCIYFVFAVVFSLLGVVFLFLAVAFQTSNGEIQRQYAREPGVFQWYVKPYCQDQSAFSDMITGFNTAEQQYASSFCQALTQNCSSGAAYDSTTPDINFVCDGLTSTNYASVCTSFATATSVLGAMVVKTGSPACTSCTFSTCSTQCATDSERSSATTTMYLFAATAGFNRAGSIASPLNDCNYLLDIGANAVSRGCPQLRDSSYLVGFGCFAAGILFSAGIVVLFRGQKVFYKLRSSDDNNDPAEMEPNKV
ncbi:membrane-associated protein, putative [Bodo saltans]|nr:membrane-associated protein, putative [Bodo saltans]|eukprot:CUG07335.1 membrane-associated protein, putative [Bodo saltans]